MKVFNAQMIDRAYLDCRRRKRSTQNALRFEIDQAENLFDLKEDLCAGTYRHSRSVCFVNEHPKPREIFAADFRDRVVHHLFVREIETHWEKKFIHDSYASRKGKGTHAAVDRLGQFVRKVTCGGRQRAWFLQMDVANFFMSIDKNILFGLIDRGLKRQHGVPQNRLPLFCDDYQRYVAFRDLAKQLIFHNPTDNYVRKSPLKKWNLIPTQKSLLSCPPKIGLPIGNLTSQFFANVYLNELDQYIKHTLKAHCYLRYVDDLVIIHNDPAVLREWAIRVENFLETTLKLSIKKRALLLKPVSCGINFLGYVTHPTHRLPRRRVIGNFKDQLACFEDDLVHLKDGCTKYLFKPPVLEKLLAVLNSYLAHFKRSSCHRVVSAILNNRHWLGRYFVFDGYVARRRWRPKANFGSFKRQVYWFKDRFAMPIIVRVGKYCEVYGADAVAAHKRRGLSFLKPRFAGILRVGVPYSRREILIDVFTNQGRECLFVDETEYPRFGLRERFSVEIWSPNERIILS